MKKLSRILRSERGDLLVGSLVSVIVVSIVMTASASFLVVAAKASIANSFIASRTILLSSTLSDERPRADSYTADPVQLKAGQDGGPETIVNIWREDTADGSFLHAATARHARDADACNAPNPNDVDCLTTQIAIPNSTAPSGAPESGYTKLELKPGTDGAKYRFSVPEGAAALQYVFKATAGDEASTLTFSRGEAKSVVRIPEDGSGYYYGALTVEPGSTIDVKTKGPATYDAGSFTVYEATDD